MIFTLLEPHGSRQHFRFAHIVPILSCLCGLKSIFLRK
nr:MAG TPA: hypothetical protein [Caudoviricetes sp.]